MRVESAGCESSPFGRQVGHRGCLDAYPAHIRLVQPSVRTAGSKTAILEAQVRRRTDAEGKPHYVLQTSQNAWNRRKRPCKM